jgi:hypothetical protein
MANNSPHAFRGEFIDLCAQAEDWLTRVLKTRAAKGDDVPHLLGLKLQATCDLVTKSPELFAKPPRVKSLLADLKTHLPLRALLAHGVLTATKLGTEEVYAFSNAGLPVTDLQSRWWIRPDETGKLITTLKQLVKELGDQKLN